MPPRIPWKALWLWILVLLPICSRGQEYIVRHRTLSVEDGLSSRFVRKVIQDERRFIWIATSEGLNRYDGHKVSRYTKEQHGLPATDINLLFEGPDGLIWIGHWEIKNHNGVMGGSLKIGFFDPKAEEAQSFQEYFGDKAPFPEEELFGLYVDNNRRAWLGTYSGKAYVFENGRFDLLVDNKGAQPISYVLPAMEQSFWLLGPGALLRVDSAGKILERSPFDAPLFLPYEIRPLQNGNLLAKAFWGMRIKYPGEQLSREYRLPGGGALNLYGYLNIWEGPNGWLWLAGKNNLEVFDAAGHQIFDSSNYLADADQYSFDAPFTSLFTDVDGLAWISPDHGLLLIDIRKNFFRPYLAGQGFSLRSMIPVGAEEILLNTYRGIHLLNLSSGKTEPLFEDKSLQGMGAIRAPDSTLWIALHSSKVARINGKYDSPELLSVKNQDDIPFEPYCPFIGKDGKLWLGTTGGIAAFDASSRQFVFDPRLNQPQYLGGKAVSWLSGNEEGLWACTNEGLFLIAPDGARIQKIEGLPSFNIFHLYPESSRRFWLSTRGSGLIRWDREEKSFRQFTMEDGLSSNIIYAAYPDERGLLWLPSQNGLMLFDTASNTVRTFKKLHGLPSDEFNAYAHLRLEDGRLLFGTIDGLASFRPQDIPAGNKEDTRVSILEARQFDSKSAVMEDVTQRVVEQGFLELSARRRFAVLRFFLDDYFKPEDNRYFYQIEGLDPNWQAMADNEVSVGLLPWGKYTLRVRAMGQDGYWAANELAIPIYSARPYYLSWWFLLAAGVTVAGLVLLLFRWRLWQLKQSKAILEAEVARRTRQIEQDRQTIAEQKGRLEETIAAKDKLFSVIGHELRGPLMYFGNIANRISYALREKQYDMLAGLGEKTRTVAASTNNLLNNLLNWSLLQSGRLSFGTAPADVEAIAGQVLKTYEEVAELKRLTINRETEPGIWVQAGADGLAILLQNLLSNAIKFSPEGSTINVRSFRENHRAVIEVADQGTGMPPQKVAELSSGAIQPTAIGTAGERGAGLGMQIVHEILKRYEGELRIESREGQGSTFTLLLPLALYLDNNQ